MKKIIEVTNKFLGRVLFGSCLCEVFGLFLLTIRDNAYQIIPSTIYVGSTLIALGGTGIFLALYIRDEAKNYT